MAVELIVAPEVELDTDEAYAWYGDGVLHHPHGAIAAAMARTTAIIARV